VKKEREGSEGIRKEKKGRGEGNIRKGMKKEREEKRRKEVGKRKEGGDKGREVRTWRRR
jgi:hypothetical protein